jgi:murein L,D-transpeptidase YafK
MGKAAYFAAATVAVSCIYACCAPLKESMVVPVLSTYTYTGPQTPEKSAVDAEQEQGSQKAAQPAPVKQSYPKCLESIVASAGERVIVVDKSSHQLSVFEYAQNSSWQLLKRCTVSTGRNPGDKYYEGDSRTPEGCYRIIKKMTTQPQTGKDYYSNELAELNKTYIEKEGIDGRMIGYNAFGQYAMLLDYPNYTDMRDGKSGGNIMIHAIKNTAYLGRDSTQGCITMAENDLKEVYRLIGEDGQVIIVKTAD